MEDNVGMSSDHRSGVFCTVILLVFIGGICQSGSAQSGSSQQSWTTSSQLMDPNGTINPTRSTTTHSEVDGRIVEKTMVEALGPDGRYVPYSEIERESVRVNQTTVRNVERSYGRTPDGQRVLTQETREESRSFAGGEKKVTRTTSNPDGNGALQVVQRALVDSKQVSPGVRETNTTVFSADGSGGLSPTVRIEEREAKTDATTIEFKKSTSLADGTDRWTLSEIREGVSKQAAGGGITKEETVLRPDPNGKMAVSERTVSKQSAESGGGRSETTETYSTDVPGQGSSEGLQLVRRESTVQRTGATDVRHTVRQVEQTNPGDPTAALAVTQEAIDIVRPGANGTATETSTVRTSDSNGQLTTVWVDMGHTDNPAVMKVDVAPVKKPK
jgi:hypothetical protein